MQIMSAPSSSASQVLAHRPSACQHSRLIYESSPHATEAGFTRPTSTQRAAATTTSGTAKTSSKNTTQQVHISHPLSTTFPAPLILPGDDLALDPKYPAQSRRAWIREKDRNKVTEERKTIYIAAPPEISADVEFVDEWCRPRKKASEGYTAEPDIQDIISYIKAFYHGLPVKQLPTKFQFTGWEDKDNHEPKSKEKRKESKKKPTSSKKPQFIALNTSSEIIRLQVRPTPKGVFSYQLNLNDLLDSAISSLPEDAYALMLLVHHDLYEDDDDEFVCGRAYGGSRVAVISTARYRPELDRQQGIYRDHAWPASHCEEYINKLCGITKSKHNSTSSLKNQEIKGEGTATQPFSLSSSSGSESDSDPEPEPPQTALHAAKTSHTKLQNLSKSPSPTTLTGLWLGRICRTVAHELGHCFGIDHCVYYACCMQGSASIIEDARQPMYLCPVDLSKVLQATGAEEREYYETMLEFCDGFKEVGVFASFGAWIRVRLREI